MRKSHVFMALIAVLLVMISCAPSAEKRTDHDHRMAMALLIAGYEVDDTACISKSYPQFMEHFRQLQEQKLSN